MAALPESSAAEALTLEPAAIESQPGQAAADPQPMPAQADATVAVQTDSAIALSAAGVSPDTTNANEAAAEATVEPAVAADALASRSIDLDPMSLDYALAQIDPSKAPPAGASADPSDPRTDAERDFDDIYGVSAYDPVADPTLPAPANVPGAYDPWEKYNRKMHRFNMAVDRAVARPLARAYSKVVPRPIRLGVSNFFNNLGQPVSILNALLQGKPKQAAQSLGRFALNSTLGIGGIFDPATAAKLPNRSEDFGQTLGVWGWKRSRYVELPFFGPRTVRDTFGMVGDAPLSPLRQIERDRIRIPLQGLQLVDVRAQLLPLDSLRDGAEDEYALVRDSWTQRRDYQIFGDRMEKNGDTQLPDYLQDDSNPSVPADAMPIMPTDGTGVR
ncbi:MULTISPECIES: MlaA family lipoprotein [Lysobacter]|uniref:MlaA family lipoprotein n=1 Tax=Lysobacter gummosus TaxID=262324 RepID=A0ABY3XEV5_9GAMM|nr:MULTISPECIES: VacJ family lipoprotein [Lysobacter]ALN89074.1 vacJ like lipofamily protein [Lysobacter gummosus]UJB18970.1 MlaA family lipoprotein [Lysobacter capsici]UJQ27305.1 MlaA family lipoprotein [Lysobacter gummosus]UNP29783.1 MlaA family lipoprotein [Lysobacter gummosus]